MNNTFDSSSYEIIRDVSSESLALLSEKSSQHLSKVTSNELLQSTGVKVYLRIKPETECNKQFEDETYTILSQSTLLTKFPNVVKKSSRNLKKPKSRDNSIVAKKIKFTEIFDSTAAQEKVFEQSVKSDIAQFLMGRNFTVITYGTTNSGKTYTQFGIEMDPGIIARSIDYIFASIDAVSNPKFKPVDGNKVVYADDRMARQKKSQRNKVSEKEVHESGMIHSIWLSFGEIYNEAVYDLLNEDPAARDTRLKLVPDKDGTFVKGLTMVHAATALEAHQILTAAVSKLRVAASAFNQHSSRSHSIFTIRLLKYFDNCSPEKVKISTLNFYDLAGSGRLENHGENDQIIAESRYINKSLLALNRCLKIIAESHASKTSEVVGPFRESCLTRLLQKSLCDKEALTIFVNLNTTPAFHVETQNIMSLVVLLRKVIRAGVNDQRVEDHNVAFISRETSNWDVSSDQVKNFDEEGANELRQQNEILMKELSALKASIFERECEARQEFADMYVRMIKEHDENWRIQMEDLDQEREKLLQMSIEQVEEYYEEKLQSITRKRKRVEFDECEEKKEDVIEVCNNCVFTFKQLQEVIKQLRKDLEAAVIEKNDCKFTISLIEKELKMLKDARNSISILQSSVSFVESSVESSDGCHELVVSPCKVIEVTEIESLEVEVDQKSSFIEELRRQLAEKDEQLKILEYNLNQCEMAKVDLMEKLMMMEQILIETNLNLSSPNSSFEFRSSEVKSSSYQAETSNLSFLYTKIDLGDSPKVVATIPKEKLSWLSQGDNRWSLPQISPEKNEVSITEVSSDSSKNDSGVTSEGFKSETEEREKIEYSHIQDKVKQLKKDYTLLKDVHHSYRSKIAELSEELESIKHLLTTMKETAGTNEQKILESEEELSKKNEEILRLRNELETLGEKHGQTRKVLDTKSQEYIQTMQELNERLKTHEDSNAKVSHFFHEYKKKSTSFESQLSTACAQFESSNFKCCTEHLPRIEELEKLLKTRDEQIKNLLDEISKGKQDLRALEELDWKVMMLSDKVSSFGEQKDEFNKNLAEKSRNEVCLELRLKHLSAQVEERGRDIEALTTELGFVKNDSKSNEECVEELNEEILKSNARLDTMNKMLFKSEQLLYDLELSLFDENGGYVNPILEEIETKDQEIINLKNKVEQQERDLQLIKETRDVFVEKYQTLVEKLKNGEEVRIPDDANLLSFVNDSADQCEPTLCNSEDDGSSAEEGTQEFKVVADTKIITIKSSNSNASISSNSSKGSMITLKSMEEDATQKKKPRNMCWMQ